MTTRKPKFSQAHLGLGADFSDPVSAATFPSHRLRFRNQDAAGQVGLAALDDQEWIQHFGRFAPFDGAQPQPLALRYHGHQFQHYNPDLGDGRGFLFAQLYDLNDGRLLDLGTKGSGITPYSRSGDGRLTLKGAVREALATAYLTALGVNTAKTLSIIETGEALVRGDEPSPTRSAVLVRLSHSHIRYGTFQRLDFEQNTSALERLIDHCLAHYWPGIYSPTDEIATKAMQLLEAVVRAKAKTVAQWMAAGFVHGVLNTDNMNITGESFDYGPYRFLPHYDPGFTAAYFDHSGLYAFGRQPQAVMWNIQRLASTLTHFASVEALIPSLHLFSERLEYEIAHAMFRRFGLCLPTTGTGEIDLARANDFLTRYFEAMRATQMPFQAPFYDLNGGGDLARQRANDSPRADLYRQAPMLGIVEALANFEALAPNPSSLTMRWGASYPDLLYDEIEQLWQSISQEDNWTPFDQKIQQLAALESDLATQNLAIQGAPI